MMFKNAILLFIVFLLSGCEQCMEGPCPWGMTYQSAELLESGTIDYWYINNGTKEQRKNDALACGTSCAHQEATCLNNLDKINILDGNQNALDVKISGPKYINWKKCMKNKGYNEMPCPRIYTNDNPISGIRNPEWERLYY